MKERGRLPVGWLGAAALAASVTGHAQTALVDPIPETIAKGDIVLEAVPFVRAPRTTDPAKPGRTNDAYARIQYLLPVPGEAGRLAFNDIRGVLYMTDMRAAEPVVYLDLRTAGVAFYNDRFPNEAGFMGFAFHPEFATEGAPGFGKLYTAFSARPGSGTADYAPEGAVQHSVLLEWTASDPAAGAFEGAMREVLRVGQFESNHNVGTIAFNPTAEPGSAEYGLLYICLGDGGRAHDPRDYGQRLDEPLGAIIRIDPLDTADGKSYGIPADNPFVDEEDVAPEIWAYGLRHPQQFSWDRNGRMFIGEIGQDRIEEVNIGVRGANYGWRLREGMFATGHAVGRQPSPVFPRPAEDPEPFHYPVAQYDHDEGFAIGGGYVYEGSDVPELLGKYLFTEFPRGRLLAIDTADLTPGEPTEITELRLQFDGQERDLADVAGFRNTYTNGLRVDARLGIDHNGELYLLTKGDGWIRKLVSTRERSDHATITWLLRRRWEPCEDGSTTVLGEDCEACPEGMACADVPATD